MIDKGPFVVGLGAIGLQLNQPVAEDVLNAYWLAFRDETDAAEWQAFCAVAVKRSSWTFLPGVPALLDALREARGYQGLEAEATTAYDRVLNAGTYSPEGGTTWIYREIRAKCGPAAAEAFLAAGGHSAFATTYGEQKRHDRFVAAYVQAARAEPRSRILGPAPERALYVLQGRK